MIKFNLLTVIFFFMSFVSLAEDLSGFHKSYLTSSFEIKQIDKEIMRDILDKIYEDGDRKCKEYGETYSLRNNQFYLKNNPFSVINVTDDKYYDIVIDTNQFNCSESGHSIFRGGTGGRIFIFVLNPSIEKIDNWSQIEKKIPFIQIGAKYNKVSKNGIYQVFARSWANIDDNLFFQIHGTFCDEPGALQCFTYYKVGINEGFTELVKPTLEKSYTQFYDYLNKSNLLKGNN